jgi:hypothetical protein
MGTLAKLGTSSTGRSTDSPVQPNETPISRSVRVGGGVVDAILSVGGGYFPGARAQHYHPLENLRGGGKISITGGHVITGKDKEKGKREGKRREATYQAVVPRDRKAPRCNRPLTDGTADGQSGGSASSGSVTWGWAGMVTCLSRDRGRKVGPGGRGCYCLSALYPTIVTNRLLDKTQGVLACSVPCVAGTL